MVRKALLAGLLLLLVPSLALAQADLTGRVSGVVTDEDGNGIAGARIELISPAMLGDRVLKADDNGKYLAALLPVGAYAMTVSAPNMQSLTYSFRIKVGQTQPLDVTLKAGEALVEEVTVYGTASILETTTIGENFNYETAVEELPIQDRDIEAVATLSPNISFGPTPGTLSISGAPSFDTVVLLDGAEVSDPYFGSAPTLFLEDAIEEVQVMTSGISARYGRFQGGVINAITKSGGNTFDGTIRAEFTNESWNSKTPFGEDQSDDLNQVYQGTVGGYIMKDRLWFFAGMRYIPDTTGSVTTGGTGESYEFATTQDRWQLKLRGAINPNHIVELSHMDYSSDRENYAGLPAASLDALGVRSDPREINTLSYQGVLSSSMFLEFLYTEKGVTIEAGGDSLTLDPFLEIAGLSGFGVYNEHWWDVNDPEDRDNETFGISATQVLSAGDWGDHTLEYGIQQITNTVTGQNRQSASGYNLIIYDYAYTFVDVGGPEILYTIGDPGQYIYRYDAIDIDVDYTQDLESLGLYVQDSWQLNKWRFDIGLRYDDWSGTGPLPTMDLGFDSLVPRLGVTYNIDDNWQAQVTYGQYSSRFNDNVAGSVSGVGGAPMVYGVYEGPQFSDLTAAELQTELRDNANWFTLAVTDPSQPTTFLADDIEAPIANDLNLTIKRALPRNSGSFSLTYSKRDFNGLLDSFVGDEGTITISNPDDALELLDLDVAVWRNSDLATRNYEAITATWDWRPGASWNIGGNYTWSQTEGNYEGEGRNTPSSGSVIGNYTRIIPESSAIPYGFLDEDRTHRMKAWGNYRFDFDRAGALNLGGIFTYQSGAAYSHAAGQFTFDDPLEGTPDEYLQAPRSFTYYFDGRGTERFAGIWRLDFSARYTFPIYRDDVSGWLKVDALNVLDNDELATWRTSGSAGSSVLFPDDGRQLVNGEIPIWTPFSSYGNPVNEGSYQNSRTYLVTLGIQF